MPEETEYPFFPAPDSYETLTFARPPFTEHFFRNQFWASSAVFQVNFFSVFSKFLSEDWVFISFFVNNFMTMPAVLFNIRQNSFKYFRLHCFEGWSDADLRKFFRRNISAVQDGAFEDGIKKIMWAGFHIFRFTCPSWQYSVFFFFFWGAESENQDDCWNSFFLQEFHCF